MLFVDTSLASEAKKWIQEYEICSGITSNPAILLKDGQKDIKQVIKDLIEVADGYPINVELTKTSGLDSELINEAVEYVGNNKEQIIIKIPFWTNGRGLRLAKQLQKIDIQCNLTCLMSTEQVILAANANVEYISLFFRRIADYYKTQRSEFEDCYSFDMAQSIVFDSSKIIQEYGLSSQLIIGSIREPRDVTASLIAGADIVTVTPKILEQMFKHSKTDQTILEFDRAWEQLKNGK
jgi:transaldolase